MKSSGLLWTHPRRRHRCRWPDTGELDLCDSDRGARLVMAIRHLGRGCVVYQPVIFQGALPPDEESAAALFALAARSLEPIPVIAQMDVLRHGLRQQTQSDEASAMVAANRSQQPSDRWCVAVAAALLFVGSRGPQRSVEEWRRVGCLFDPSHGFGMVVGISAQIAAEGFRLLPGFVNGPLGTVAGAEEGGDAPFTTDWLNQREQR